MTEAVRLSKRLAAQLSCSRSEAERYIEGGWVRVDGRVVEEPQFRVLHEKIELDPHARLTELPPVTLLLHKPADHPAPLTLLSAASHWSADPCARACSSATSTSSGSPSRWSLRPAACWSTPRTDVWRASSAKRNG